MAALPLSQTLDASSRKRRWPSSVLSLLTSIVLQGAAVGSLVLAPLVAMQSLPEPRSRYRVPVFVPVVPHAPPRAEVPRPVRAERSPATGPPSIAAALERVLAPVEIPDGIPDEPTFASEGVRFGMPRGNVGAPSAGPVSAVTSPAPVEPLRPGGNIRKPRKIHHVDPVYPRIAAASRIQGTVALETTIDSEGNVVDLRVVESIPLLDRAAIEAVRRWRYEPTYLNGTPVPVLLQVEVVFVLG